jgi:glyoxylate reductase
MLYRGRWAGWTPTQLVGVEVTGSRIGIFGMGRIGRTIARRARSFDMKIHYHNRRRLKPALEEGACHHATVEGLLAVSDVLVLAAPSTPETRGLLNAARLALMPPGAIVVNIARGDLVDDEALIAALQSGRIAAAGLDVFSNEPRLHKGYLALPNVFLQPHQGSSTLTARLKMAGILMDGTDAVLAGRPATNRLV